MFRHGPTQWSRLRECVETPIRLVRARVFVPLPYSVIVPSNVSAFTPSPSLKRISDSTPVAGAVTSTVVPSVSISTSGSSTLTGSPTRLSHRPIDAFVTDTLIFGTRISVAMIAILWNCDAACPSLKKLKKFKRLQRRLLQRLKRRSRLTSRNRAWPCANNSSVLGIRFIEPYQRAPFVRF